MKANLTYLHLGRVILSSLFAATLFSASLATAEEYEIDSSHSRVGFKVRHLGLSNVIGQFGSFSGVISYDPTKVAGSTAVVVVAVKSIDTDEKKRDDHLRAEDFFNSEKFPEIKFVSKSVKAAGDKTFAVTGDLTIKDVTKPVTLTVEYQGTAKDPYGNDRVAFSATSKIDRREFGLTWSKILETGAIVVGNDVSIEIDIEAVKKKA